MNYIEALLNAAHEEVGVVEHGAPNWGPRVSQYLAAVGINFPASWCAAFGRFCMLEAAHAVGYLMDGSLRVSSIPILYDLAPRDFAACSMIGGYAYKEALLFPTPKVGDLFLIRNDEGHFHHTGIVTGVRDGAYTTVEGNTNDDGSANGYGVFARERALGPHSRFVRFADEIAGLAPAPRTLDPNYMLVIGGRNYITKLIGDRSYLPVRAWARAMGFQFDWDRDGNTCTFDGAPFLGELLYTDGQNFAAVRALAAFSGLMLTVDSEKRTAEVSR